jgi:DNA (cytosine-5)-methyltransferase 1
MAPLPPLPEPLVGGLHAYIETMGEDDERWWGADRVERFVGSLSRIQLERIRALQSSAMDSYRTAYRRTRHGVAVWEVRPDEVSGCLRTARGGSSKQAVVRVRAGNLQVRWMTPLEYARLMGAGDYNIAGVRDSQVLFGFGDAVCAPAVAWVAEHYLLPALRKAAFPPSEMARLSG